MNIDMWYGDKKEDAEHITIMFNDIDCYYWGNIYIKGKCVGDYTTKDSLKIEKAFPHLQITWG